MIKCSQAETSEDFEKNKTDLFEFQFVYGSWQEWKPLKRVQTLKIKKSAVSLLPLSENFCMTIIICCTVSLLHA